MALSTLAVCRAKSSFTNRWNLARQRQVTAAPGLDYCLHDLANTGLVQHSIDETQAVKLLALTPHLFCRLHTG